MISHRAQIVYSLSYFSVSLLNIPEYIKTVCFFTTVKYTFRKYMSSRKRCVMWSTDFISKGLLAYKDPLISFFLIFEIRDPPHQKSLSDFWLYKWPLLLIEITRHCCWMNQLWVYTIKTYFMFLLYLFFVKILISQLIEPLTENLGYRPCLQMILVIERPMTLSWKTNS